MELYILRHAEAGNRLPASAKDAERPLTVKGKEELEDVARSLVRLKIKPDHIGSSPLKRTMETAEVVAKTLKGRHKVEVWGELTPEGNRLELYARLSKMKQESSVLIIGHEPYLSQTISDLMGQKGPSRIVMRKSGLARVSIKSFAPKAQGELRWLLTPKLLKRIS